MPISKNNVLYYTEEQKLLADQNSSALDYAMQQGYNLIRKGGYYIMAEHDSMVFAPDGAWHWNSRGLHGRAPEFMMAYEGKTFVEAILQLSGESAGSHAQSITPPPRHTELKRPEFALPEKADTSRHLFGYLCETRCLSYQVVKEMIRQGILYESSYTTKSGQEIHNACFVSYDNEGKPCSAFKRSLASYGTPYKGEVPGGDKGYGWIFHGRNPEELYVFEAAIDAASYVTIEQTNHRDPLRSGDYMALSGLTFSPVEAYLKSHANVRTVHLMLDNDQAGRSASEKFVERLRAMGCHVENHIPPEGKDWNEYLQQQVKNRSPPGKHTYQDRIFAAKSAAAAARVPSPNKYQPER